MAGLGRAEPEEAAIELLQVSGKVFGRHGRFVDLSQNVGAKAVLGHTGDKSGLLGRVADSGITPFIASMPLSVSWRWASTASWASVW